MAKLTYNDTMYVLSRLPKDVINLMKESRLLLAGGFIRETIAGGKVNDIDLFGPNKDKLEAACMKLCLARKGRMFGTDNAFTMLSPPRSPVQFITRWLAEDYETYVKLFDFTVCQAGIWWDPDMKEPNGEHFYMDSGGWTSACHDDFYADLAARRLVYTFPDREEEAGGSMLRMKKFMKRGYDVQIGSMAGVMSRIVGRIESHDPRLKDEKWVARIIQAILREVDPMTIVDGVEVQDPLDGGRLEELTPRS
jgi:hypothetical protein